MVSHRDLVEGISFSGGGAKNVLKKSLISKNEGWEDYVMRYFEVGEGGCSPKHIHPWPHIVYVLGGEGIIEIDGINHDIKEGSYAFIPVDTEHQFLNSVSDNLTFICIVPPEGD